MPNTKILKENGQEFYPVTHASLIVGMENQGRMDATYAWDGTGTPDITKIPAGVVVTYDGTSYTGTLAASADTAGRFYLVPSTTVTGEYDRYLTDATGSTITWKPAGTTAIPTPSILDNVTSTDTDKALSANQGKLLKDDLSQLEAEVTDLDGELNGGTGLNPANLLTDPTFEKGEWELQNGTVTLSDVPGSLSKKATVVRVNTGASAYYFLRLPVSLFEDGKTYRITVINNTGSQKLAVRNDNGSGFVGYILADVDMTTQNLGDGRYYHTYDWTVSAASFGSYGYVQIAFKFYDDFWFEEPFTGLASGNTNYAVTSTRTVLKKTDVVDNLLSDESDAPLSARQGKVLNEKMDNLPYLEAEEVSPVNKCPGDFYDNKYYGSGSGQIMEANNYACAKPFLLPAGNYLYIVNKQMFGSGAGPAYIFNVPDDTVAASSVPGTLLEERTSGGYTMGIYAVTIPTDSYVGFNVGLIQDEAGFMVVEGTTIADWPSSYEPYFEPYKKLPDDVKITVDTNPLLGKKLAVEGDSICQGAGMNGGYAKIIGENNEMTVANNGVSGGTITYGTKYSNNTDRHWICTGISLMPQDYDYYIFEGGVNDCGNQVTIGDLVNGYPVEGGGDTLNKETLIGAMEYACRSLVTTFPGKKCGFIFVHGIFGNDSQLRVYWAEAKEKMIRALKKWGVPYIDLESLVPPLNCIQSLKSVYTANGDGWHPNELGYNTFYVYKITEWMKTL